MIQHRDSLVRIVTPTMSRLLHVASVPSPTFFTLGSCAGMKKAPIAAIGSAMIATNQNTQFHDVNWTNIAPMTTPRATRI